MQLPPKVTPRAFERLAEIGASGNGKALRVAVEGGGCSGFQYEIELDEPRADDLVLEGAGEKVVVDAVSLPFLADAVIDFIKVHAASLNALPSALVSVSLAAAFEGGHRDAQAYVDRLLERTGWRPTAVHLAAGALNSQKYDYFQEQIIRHVVLKDREPDDIVGDHDFTDWDALAQFVKDFEVASSAVKSVPGAGGSFP